MKSNVLGITGPFASGKETLVEELRKRGFNILYLGDQTRKEADHRGLAHTRQILQDMGNDLRQKYGDSVLIRRAEKLLDGTEEKIVFDGLRNAGEIKYLKEKYNAFIIGVITSTRKRLVFSLKRGNDADPKTKIEFSRDEARDRGIGEGPHGQQADECLKLSDIIIENNGTLAEFKQKILQEILQVITK